MSANTTRPTATADDEVPATCTLCGQPLADAQMLSRYLTRQAQRDADLRSCLRDEIAAEYEARERVQAKLTHEAAEALVEKRYERRFRQMEVSNRGLHQQLEVYKRSLENLSPANRGRFNEEDLVGVLRVEFPHDDFELVRSGPARRPDILHEVRSPDGQIRKSAGLIVYECKDTARWETDFVAQAAAARLHHRAAHAVLVTRAFPSDRHGFAMVDDVAVVDASTMIAIARILRDSMVQLAQLKVTAGQRAGRAAELLRYLTSDDFAISFAGVRSAAGEMRKALDKERGAHDRAWAHRDHCYRRIAAGMADIDGGISRAVTSDAKESQSDAATLTLVASDGENGAASIPEPLAS